jgi:hypothetical protein
MKTLMSAVLILVTSLCFADTTENLITPDGYTGHTYQDNINGQNPVDVIGCCTGSGAFLDPSVGNGIIYFSYSRHTVAQTIAINNALSGSGIKITGYNYGWYYYNQDYNRGTLSATVELTNPGRNVLEQYNYSLGPTTNGWTFMGGTQNFTQEYGLSQVGNLTVKFTGNDDRFWSGFYGPAVGGVSLSLNYGSDQCAVDPLSSPSCPEYEQAFFNQQCSISALYSPSCPGYVEAYLSLQCTANPLYSPSCPGYQQAYFDQQCKADALYDIACPGYKEAYALKNVIKKEETKTEQTDVAGVSSPVESTLTPPSTSSPVPTGKPSVLSSPPAVATSQTTTPPPAPVESSAKKEEKAQEQKKVGGAIAKAERSANARKEIAEKAKQLAEKSKESKSIEEQMENQGLQVGLMGYVAGFSGYEASNIPDTNGLLMARKYNKPTVDNKQAQRYLSGANDVLHQMMVEQQYQLGK